MTPPADPTHYKNHRFPGEIISHGIWLYSCFPLSYRDVQELLLERGINVTYEAIRQRCLTMVSAIICGELWIRTIMSSIFWWASITVSGLLSRCSRSNPVPRNS